MYTTKNETIENESIFKSVLNLEKEKISRLTLEFRDKRIEEAYINSYFRDYIKIVRLVIGVITILTFIFDIILFKMDDSVITNSIVLSNIIFGVSVFFLTFFSYIKRFLTTLIFFAHILIPMWVIEFSINYSVSNLLLLQLIICFTIFPRNYFKYSIIANSFIMVYYLFSKYGINYLSIESISEILIIIMCIFYVEFANYLKEITNKKDYLNSIKIKEQEKKSNELLENTLPKEVAKELKLYGKVEPKNYSEVSILFTDFKNFTKITEGLTPSELLKDLDGYFFQFDEIVKRFNMEKLKTIGDAYMCVGGIPIQNHTHAIDACLTGLEMQNIMNQMKKIKTEMNIPYWELRIGIHTGDVIAGVIGKTKFAFDIWGDSVNLASRMESSGVVGKVNISEATYLKVKDLFECEYRGEIEAKNKGKIKMFFLKKIKDELSINGEGLVPNDNFNKIYNSL